MPVKIIPVLFNQYLINLVSTVTVLRCQLYTRRTILFRVACMTHGVITGMLAVNYIAE